MRAFRRTSATAPAPRAAGRRGAPPGGRGRVVGQHAERGERDLGVRLLQERLQRGRQRRAGGRGLLVRLRGGGQRGRFDPGGVVERVACPGSGETYPGNSARERGQGRGGRHCGERRREAVQFAEPPVEGWLHVASRARPPSRSRSAASRRRAAASVPADFRDRRRASGRAVPTRPAASPGTRYFPRPLRALPAGRSSRVRGQGEVRRRTDEDGRCARPQVRAGPAARPRPRTNAASSVGVTRPSRSPSGPHPSARPRSPASR